MRLDNIVGVVKAHSEGEVGWVVVSGIVDLPGKNIKAKQEYLVENEHLLGNLLQEPRGSSTTSVNLIVPSDVADFGLVTVESDASPPISGSNTICAVTVALETGMVRMKEPATTLRIETPAGIVTASARCRNGACEEVKVSGIDCFPLALDHRLQLPSGQSLLVDIVYSGAVFAIVKAADLGLQLNVGSARKIVDEAKTIFRSLSTYRVDDPRVPDSLGLHFVLVADPVVDQRALGAVFIPPGRLDRSPCGTGTLARLTSLHFRGELSADQFLVQESILGGRFKATPIASRSVLGRETLEASVEGRAWIFGTASFGSSPGDIFPDGFRLADLW